MSQKDIDDFMTHMFIGLLLVGLISGAFFLLFYYFDPDPRTIEQKIYDEVKEIKVLLKEGAECI